MTDTQATTVPEDDDEFDLFSEYAQNEDGEQTGLLMTLPSSGPKLWKIARAGNKNFQKAFRRLYKQNERILKKEDAVADEKAKEIDIELTATYLLVGWEKPVKFKGEVMEYTPENAKKILTALPEFRAEVIAAARVRDNFKLVKSQELEKN